MNQTASYGEAGYEQTQRIRQRNNLFRWALRDINTLNSEFRPAYR